ncbi:colanic acid biosynthesis glycosyltransferase WcaL [Bryobacterales bacterium F-183]|nr:colanic acid biosynthesis glycosyltransferase WcaL [Bryobacterales bacterium F-183]
MRVGVLIRELPAVSAGPDNFLADQITGLLEMGCDVEVFPSENSPPREPGAVHPLWQGRAIYPLTTAGAVLSGRANPGMFHVLRYGRYASSLRLWREAAAFAKRPRFDAVHCHFAANGKRGSAFRDLGLIDQNTRLITSLYVNDADSGGDGSSYARMFANTDMFLCPNDTLRYRMLALGAPPERTQVHKLGIPIDQFRHRGSEVPTTPPDRNARLRLVTVAPLVGQEGVEFAIRAIAVLRNEVPGLIRYEVFGDGPLRPHLLRLIRSLELDGSVTLAGEQPRPIVAHAIAKADVLLAPGAGGELSAGPSALLDAMASGVAVVAARRPGATELVHDGVSGILIEDRDVRGIAAALASLCREPGRIESMGQAGRKAALQNHDLYALNRALLEHYEAITLPASIKPV